jgi:hypothetical protein
MSVPAMGTVSGKRAIVSLRFGVDVLRGGGGGVLEQTNIFLPEGGGRRRKGLK